jgi:CheY-like chemotaxis protein
MAVIEDELPDLVLLDYMMPIMNGQQFCHAKSQIPRLSHIPVVMMSASGNLVKVMDACETQGYMSKPMDLHIVVKMVNHFLDSNELPA